MTVFIPGVLPTLNEYIVAERANRFAAAKLKKDATYKCKEYFDKLTPVDSIGPVRFVWLHPNKRKDFDNVEFGQKFVFDGMVKAEFIKGDGWRHRAPFSIHEHRVSKDRPGVMVAFEPSAGT